MVKINIWKDISHPKKCGVLTVYHGRKIVVEGVERIIFCHSEKVKLQSKTLIQIEGKNLALKELGNENIAICGKIEAILFGEKKV